MATPPPPEHLRDMAARYNLMFRPDNAAHTEHSLHARATFNIPKIEPEPEPAPDPIEPSDPSNSSEPTSPGINPDNPIDPSKPLPSKSAVIDPEDTVTANPATTDPATATVSAQTSETADLNNLTQLIPTPTDSGGGGSGGGGVRGVTPTQTIIAANTPTTLAGESTSSSTRVGVSGMYALFALYSVTILRRTV